ncbi:hypothetical protein [Pseudomonas sp. NY15374]|uniref:hypothetical protein n=1 Tax=Pseudomonas sp. NY15374 TaxID=3400357 RepID=UPI003A8879C0
MKKYKHTPGPWLVEGFVQNTGSISVCAGRMGIADVFNGVSIFETLTGEAPRTQMANAQLIATAPNLLDDLVEAAATLRRYEALHRAKGTTDSVAKAEVNAELASRFEQTIALATA